MSAAILRAAAALMRERAEAATPGPWVADEGASGGVWVETPTATIANLDIDYSTPRPDAEHIASWHPVVALAVADWLDSAASMGDQDGEPIYDAALAVARAYLATP